MASTEASSVLRRMLGAAPAQTDTGVPPGLKPFASLLEKLADRSLSMPLVVSAISQTTVARDLFLAELTPPVVMLRLQSDAATFGMAGCCANLRAALIEVQTTGKIASTAASDRAATDADAALCSGFIADALAQAHHDLEQVPLAPWRTPFRPAGLYPAVRAMGLSIEDVPLTLMTLSLDLGSGARQGTLRLLIPQPAAAVTGRRTGGDWQRALRRAVDDAPVPLQAVLHRKTMSLSDVQALVEGDMLTLPRSAADKIMLVASETCVGPFKLGQIGGQKALRRQPTAPPPGPAPAPDPLHHPAAMDHDPVPD